MRKVSLKEKELMVDGFDTPDVEQEASDERRVVRGSRLTYTMDDAWVTEKEEEIAPDRELVVVDYCRVLQKWGADKMPLETRWLMPGERVDVEALNAAVPKEQWREGLNGPVGPFQQQRVLYMLDPMTMEKYTYVTSTVGGNMAIGDLIDKIRTMRRLRGSRVLPVITLANTFMKTRYGGRQRPNFKIVRWMQMGAEGTLTAPNTPLLTGTPVAEPTLKEEMGGDEVKY